MAKLSFNALSTLEVLRVSREICSMSDEKQIEKSKNGSAGHRENDDQMPFCFVVIGSPQHQSGSDAGQYDQTENDRYLNIHSEQITSQCVKRDFHEAAPVTARCGNQTVYTGMPASYSILPFYELLPLLEEAAKDYQVQRDQLRRQLDSGMCLVCGLPFTIKQRQGGSDIPEVSFSCSCNDLVIDSENSAQFSPAAVFDLRRSSTADQSGIPDFSEKSPSVKHHD